MPHYTLYHMPGACSRVTMNALEEAGIDYADVALDLLKGDQRDRDYLAMNPGGKVPALRVDDRLLVENAAILMYLDRVAPEAALLPRHDDPVEQAAIWSDLIWCSSTVHPIVRMVRMPGRFTDGETDGIHAKGLAMIAPVLARIEARLAAAAWWYGERWSIVDVYLYWNYSTAGRSAALDAYPAIRAHGEQVRARPSFVRALAREEGALAAQSIALPPGASL